MKRTLVSLAALAGLLGCATVFAQGRPQRPAPRPMPPQAQPRPDVGRPTQPGSPAPQAAPQGQGKNDQQSVSARLEQNTKLAARLQQDLPAGMDVQQAGAGFKNLGLFVATVQASKNLDIPFDTLKTHVNGGASLGDAIHELKPDVDAKAEEKKAKQQANRIMKESGS